MCRMFCITKKRMIVYKTLENRKQHSIGFILFVKIRDNMHERVSNERGIKFSRGTKGFENDLFENSLRNDEY